MKINPLAGHTNPHAFQQPVQAPGKVPSTADRVRHEIEDPTRESAASTSSKGSTIVRDGEGIQGNRQVQEIETIPAKQLEAQTLREISLAGDLTRRGVQLRPFRPEDLSQVLQIAAANFSDKFGKSLSNRKETLEGFLEDFGFVPTQEEPGYIVAEGHGRILGFLRLRHASDQAPSPPLNWGKRLTRHGMDMTLKGALIKLLTEKGLDSDECLIENLEILPEMHGKGILAGLLGKARELATDVEGCRHLSLPLPEKEQSGQAVGEALQFQHYYTQASLMGMAFLGLPAWTYLRLPLAEDQNMESPGSGLLKTWLRRKKKLWWLGFLGFLAIFKFPDMISALAGSHSPRVFVHILWLWYFRYFLPRRR